jgi:aspartyl protease family protein
LSGPIKTTLYAAIIATVAGAMLAAKMPANEKTAPAMPASSRDVAPTESWFSRWFGGISINRNEPASQAAALQPQTQIVAVGAGYGRYDIKPDRGGQYRAEVDIEGQRIAMLVDTGATLIALTAADADRLGVHTAPADRVVPVQTANGVVKVARVTLREVRLGTLEVRNVDAIVFPDGASTTSLLGMSFLKKLSSFEIAQGSLQLRQ